MSATVKFASSATMQILDGSFSSGGLSTSSNFQLNGAISQISIGPSATTSYNLNTGWLYFPVVNTPIVSATAGDGQVSLSWTPAVGELGWTVAGYSIGWSTASSGPYSYISNDSATDYIKTGLTNSTAYYFIIRVMDAFDNTIATSTVASATPVATAIPPTCGNGSCSGGETCSTCPADCGQCSSGGGGGGSYTPPAVETKVNFSGRAYPKSAVTLLKDAQVAATTIAGSDANFSISISGLAGGNYIFAVYSEDNNGIRSSLLTFPVSITVGATTNVSGIFIAPTIAVDKSEVKRGDNITIFGQSAPLSEITISVNSDEEFFVKKASDASGAYLINFDTSVLEMGQHNTKSKVALSGEISSFSKVISFAVGAKNILAAIPEKTALKGDLNNDNRVNLIDFSISAYWYKRSNPPATVDLNGDKKVDLVDFSIMAYYWTG